MTYLVFEAGSRCGLSAMLFFLEYVKRVGTEDWLLLVDRDEHFVESIRNEAFDNIASMTEKTFFDSIAKNMPYGEYVVFPADELTRQKGFNPHSTWFNEVKKDFYNKKFVNLQLKAKGFCVPPTFEFSNVIVRPNTMSAGSKGIMKLENVCVSSLVDIAHEYVVDCFFNPSTGYFESYSREVSLKNGYDQYVKFLPSSHPSNMYVTDLCHSVNDMMFSGLFHVQLMEDSRGNIYYIESSKRMSGTCLVNMLRGFRPFDLINGVEIDNRNDCYEGKWYKYDYLLDKVKNIAYE